MVKNKKYGINTNHSGMTGQDLMKYLQGKNFWETVELPGHKPRGLVLSDGPHGVRREHRRDGRPPESEPSVAYPVASLLAASWDEQLVEKVGTAMGEDSVRHGVDVLLAPGVNIKRTPLNGRNFEFLSEDPLLAGKLGAAMIRGIQSQGVAACLKHLAVNNQETNRMHISAEVDTRTLREIYLKPFEIAVREGKPWSVMCAYNRLNGTYCSENHWLLTQVLREQWGFDGVVVSDWGAVKNRERALNAGVDLAMPYASVHEAQLTEALAAGRIQVTQLSASATRLADLAEKTSHPVQNRRTEEDQHRVAAIAAAESMVLLKNDPHLLPLSRKTIQRIAVLGEFAENPVIQGLGSARVKYSRLETPLEAIRDLAGKDMDITYLPVYDVNRRVNEPALQPGEDPVLLAKEADVVLMFAGLPPEYESEGMDRTTLELPQNQQWILNTILGIAKRVVLIVQSGAPVNLKPWSDKAEAVLWMGMAGQAGGRALAEILFGLRCPSGRLAETWPVSHLDSAASAHYPGNGRVVQYQEGLMVGYRDYTTRGVPVQFAFGHGLGYTDFDYGNLSVVTTENSCLKISLTLTNTGSNYGAEVVQIYTGHEGYLSRPVRELKAFRKVFLNPGAGETLVFELPFSALACYPPGQESGWTEEGIYTLSVGASVTDIRLEAQFTMPEVRKDLNKNDVIV